MISPPASRRPDAVLSVQYLRGVAALLVVIFHLGEASGFRFAAGASGVDLFFVISGFIMWITVADRPTRPREFLRRRVERVVPLYWIATAVTALAILVKPQFMHGHGLTLENLLRSLVFAPQVVDGHLKPVLLQGWTLTFEMIFYGVFAAALALAGGWRLLVASAVLIGLVAALTLVQTPEAQAYASWQMLEFIAGMLIGYAFKLGLRVPAWTAAALGLLGVGLFAVAESEPLGLRDSLGWGVASVMIVAGAVFFERGAKMPRVRPLVLLGDASYSIYLWHVLLISVCTGVSLRLGLGTLTQSLVCLAGALCGGVVLYALVERPLVRGFAAGRARRSELEPGLRVQTAGAER